MPSTVYELVLKYLEVTCPKAAQAFKKRGPTVDNQTEHLLVEHKTMIEDALRLYDMQGFITPQSDEDEPLYRTLGTKIMENRKVRGHNDVRKRIRTENSESDTFKKKYAGVKASNTINTKTLSDGSSSDGEPAPKMHAKPTGSPKSNNARRRQVVNDGSSSDDEPIWRKHAKPTSSPKSNNTGRRQVVNDGSSSDDEPAQKMHAKPTSSPKSNNARRRQVVSDGSSDDEPIWRKHAKPTSSPKSNNTGRRQVVDDGSSSDDEPAQKMHAKPTGSPKSNNARRRQVVNDGSSSDDEPIWRKHAKPTGSPKSNNARRRQVVNDGSSSDDEPIWRKHAKPTSSPKSNNTGRKQVVDDGGCGENVVGKKRLLRHSDSTDAEPLKKLYCLGARGAPTTVQGGHEEMDLNAGNVGGERVRRPFQRIDPSKVVFANDILRNNGPQAEHMALRQNQEMMRVKGKSFNKLKQKNKAKLYASGVDLTVRSVRFSDSD